MHPDRLASHAHTTQARIQDSEGGVSYIQKGGGGGFVQEFQERIQIVAGPWANQQATKKLQTAVGGGGGGSDHPKKTPGSAPATPKHQPFIGILYCEFVMIHCVSFTKM